MSAYTCTQCGGKVSVPGSYELWHWPHHYWFCSLRCLSDWVKVDQQPLLDIDPLDFVFSVPEVAKKLDMGEVQVRRKIYDGTLQARKSGGTWLVKLG